MSAAATLAPQLPPPSQSQLLSLTNASNSSLLSKRSSESPRSVSSKTSVPAPSAPSPVHQAAVQQREGLPEVTMKSPPSQILPMTGEDRKPTSPAPMKLPDAAPPAAVSSKEPLVSPPLPQQALITRNSSTSPNNRKNSINNDYVSNTASEQAPAQLALLLSQALADADALRRELASEKKRVARAERLLAALQAPSSPNSASTSTDARNSDGRLHESAAKAILDAETRAEKAERARDDAIHALASLTASFAELERYEAACVLRASDARGAYSRLLTSLSTAHPLPQPSSGVSNNSPRDEPRLNLPRVPAPLPSLPPVTHLPGPSFSLAPPPAPPQSSRYGRSLQTHSTFTSAQSPIDARQANAFDSLALPPPPAATGLASINTSLPLKRSHSYRSRAEEAEYEDQKRRRLTHEMDVDVAGPDVNSVYTRTSSRHYQSGPPSAQPLSGHPSALPPLGSGLSPPSRIDRTSSVQYAYSPASGPSYQREGISPYAPPPSAGSRYPMYDDRERECISRDRDAASGMVRIDARELVREAKARERRGRERESFVRLPQSESHLHPQSQGDLHMGSRARGRSASRSSSRSKSSLSLDEMLLETATDGGRGRPSPPEQHASGPGGMRQAQNFGIPPSVNGVSPPLSAAPPPASHPMSKAPSTHAPAINGVGRKSSIPASQLMTLGPSGTIVSGGGSEAPGAAGSVDPAVRFPGLRTCRQCFQPGRYKDGKCVEKWGPGPQGPGTVCDRCRKKMKRVERRGTLDSSASLRGNHSQSQSQSQKVSQPTLSLAPSQSSYSQSYSQSQSQSGRTRAPPVRTDTLIVDNERHQSDPSQSRSLGHNSSSYHGSVPPASAAARHPSLASPAHYVTPHAQSHHQHHAQSRRAPTPPFITAIPSREQHGHRAEATRHADSNSRRAGAGAESDDNLLEDEDRVARSGDRSASGARYAHSESYARQPLGERDERDELADDADADADADADGSGVGSADVEAEDAEIMDAVDATMKVEE
ncbi:hypothetical protein ACEPAI_6472 [Sanghuangporus weigelae]